MKIKAIGFDYGGVLAGESGVFFGEQIADALGITFERYKEVYFRHNKPVQRGEWTWKELWAHFLDDIGQPEKLPEIMHISDDYGKRLHTIEPKMLKLVDEVRELGFKTGLLSNNSKENGDKFRARGIDDHFDIFHVSEETGLVKPEPQAFKHFAECLGIELGELVFIDDSPKSLSTSDECGYTPILFETYEKLKTQLAELGVLPSKN